MVEMGWMKRLVGHLPFIRKGPVGTRVTHDKVISIRKGKVRTDRSDDGFELRLKDKKSRTTVFKDELDFGWSQTPVQRDQNGSHHRKTKKNLEVLRTIIEKDRHSISLFDF
jgi:hypothetical protein